MKTLLLFIGGLLLQLTLSGQDAARSFILSEISYSAAPTGIAIAPDASLLLCGFEDGAVRLLDPSALESRLEIKEAHIKAVLALDMPAEKDFFMTAGGNLIRLWTPEGELIRNLNGHATSIWNLDIGPGGKQAVSAAYNKTFLFWDLEEKSLAGRLKAHEDICLSARISPDGKLAASGSFDHSIRIWDLESTEVLRTLPPASDAVYDVDFSPDGQRLAAASAEKNIRIYQVDDGSLLQVLTGHSKAVRRVHFHPGGRYLASVSEEGTLMIWDQLRGERIYSFFDEKGLIMDMAWHPDGKSLYYISQSGSIVHAELHPEIFVHRYYGNELQAELQAEPLFEARRKGESKKDYQLRQASADSARRVIIDAYYARYLEGLDAQ